LRALPFDRGRLVHLSARHPWYHIVTRPNPRPIRIASFIIADVYLGKSRSPASLNGLDLRGGKGSAVEAGGKVVTVEVVALGGCDRSEIGTGQAADTAAA